MVNLSILANMLARQAGMQVVWDSNAPTFAIRKEPSGTMTVIIPPSLAAVDPAEVVPMSAMLRGAMAHEALGHGRHTDFSVWGSTAFAQSLANVLEDVRIEALAPRELPGARKILAEMAGEVDARGFWDPTADVHSCIGLGILRTLRTEILRQPLDLAKNATCEKGMRGALGDALTDEVMVVARRGATGSSTREAVEAAEEICRLLQQPQQQPQSQQPQAQSQQSTAGQQGGAGNGQSQPSQPGHSGSTQADQSGQSVAPGKDGQGAQGANGSHQDAGQGAGGDLASSGGGQPDIGKTNAQGATGNGQGRGGNEFKFNPNATFNVSPEDVIKEWVATNDDSTYVKPAGDLRKTRNSQPKSSRPISSMAHKLRTRMRDLLQAQAEDEDDAAGETGRLLSVSMLPARLGKRDVFYEEGDTAPGLDTAIEIMVDASGSMSGITTVVTDCLMAVGDACAEFNGLVDVSMSFFNDGRTVLLKHDETWKAHRSQIAACYRPTGGTMWASSAMTALASVASSRRNRKIVLTITDGDFGAAQDVIETAKMANIELANVVIGSDQKVPGMVVENVVNWHPDAFVNATFRAIQRAMRPQ
ncbi:hypothetical protein R77560_04073 [Ralstonia thomasii]|uniref:VWFA domain-containing protein n=7 Tax=Bacteria TaxID=2 RepID=A0AAD2BTH3_9RALS|nr:hypothetical protein R77560_04073 [Ralstonia sp. LMG 18095]